MTIFKKMVYSINTNVPYDVVFYDVPNKGFALGNLNNVQKLEQYLFSNPQFPGENNDYFKHEKKNKTGRGIFDALNINLVTI